MSDMTSPTSTFLFYVEEGLSDSLVQQMATVVDQLQHAREWTVAPPFIVDEAEDGSDVRPPDQPVRTVGVALHVHSTHPRARKVDPAIDRAELQAVEYLISVLSPLTLESPCEIGVEYCRELIGVIVNGKPDNSLQVGLLDPWRRALGLS